MKKLCFLIVFIICLVLGIVVFDTTSTSQTSFTQKEKIILPIRTLKNQSFSYRKNFIGSVQAIQSVSIVPYLSGFLKEVRVQSGKEVTEGETLFLLDERIPLSNLNQAKEAVSQAYASRENAKIYYERMKNTDIKAISSSDLEQAKTEFESADAAYQKAIAAQHQAQTLYDYTIIQAPISGLVGNITATIGEYLSPESKTLATLVRFSPIRLTFSIPMSLYKGDNFSKDSAILQVLLSDGNTLEFTDFKVARNNQANQSTDSLSFFIDVPNEKKLLMPGSYIEINFIYSQNGILVDKNWVTLTPDGAEATFLKDGLIEKRKIKIGVPIANQYWIQSGINEGDQIITVPISPFQIGQPAEGVLE